jgi:hypothetical protein
MRGGSFTGWQSRHGPGARAGAFQSRRIRRGGRGRAGNGGAISTRGRCFASRAWGGGRASGWGWTRGAGAAR